MATITKTPSGTWKAVIRKQGWPTVSKTFRIKRDAEDWSRNTEDEMVRGLFIRRSIAEKMLFAEAVDRYRKEVTPTKKPSTPEGEAYRFNNILKPFGAYALASITPDMVARFRDQRLAEGKSNNTVRLDLALMSHIYTTAIQEWGTGLTVNPVALIKKPSPGKARERRLTAEEELKIVQALKQHRNPMMLWIVTLAIQTGMRASEIVGITDKNVDLNKRIIRLYDTKNNESRTVPLTHQATETLKLALDNPARPMGATDLVFCGSKNRNGGYSPYQFSKNWTDMLKRLGIQNLHFHDLRHEAVSRLVEGGLSDQEVASISGHKSMQMLRRYTHLRAEDLVAKLDKIEQNHSYHTYRDH